MLPSQGFELSFEYPAHSVAGFLNLLTIIPKVLEHAHVMRSPLVLWARQMLSKAVQEYRSPRRKR
jgi:hypothetical protein